MAYNYEYPYTDPQRYNADWLLSAMKRLEEEWKIFVPTHDVKFGGEWNGTLTYGAYTIVSDSNLNSYISIKAVPAGIQISNTEYWVKIGEYNAQIMALENKVNQLFRDRNFLLLADSYGMRDTSKPTWTENFTARFPNSRQISVSSRGFLTNGNTFLMGMEAFYNELTPEEREKITDIVVCGGWNDARAVTNGADVADLQRAIFSFVDYCNIHFKNAKPWIGFIGWQTIDCVQPETNADSLRLVEKIYMNTKYSNLMCLEGVQDIMKCSQYMDETFFHPNAAGSAELFFGISGALFGGYRFRHSYRILQNDFVFADGNSGNIANGFVTIDGNTATLSLVITGANITNSEKIGTFASNILPNGALTTVIGSSVIDNGKAAYTVLHGRDLLVYENSPTVIILKMVFNTEFGI